MAVTALEGIVESGQVRLLDDKTLPEHARVFVIIPDLENNVSLRVASPRLVHKEQACDFEKTVTEVDENA
jgi:hypothetical protein